MGNTVAVQWLYFVGWAMKKTLVFLFSGLMISAAQADGDSTPNAIPASLTCPKVTPDSSDVSGSLGFEACKSKVDDIQAKYGRPRFHNKGPYGTYTDMYTTGDEGLIVVFLFGKDDVLIRTVAYSHTK